MSLDEVEQALQSLAGWSRVVGCMGGEPTIHPQFEEICKLYQKYFPRPQCGLWTSGGPGFEKNRLLIHHTFGVMLYNDHSEVGKHHPWLIAIEEVIDDERLRDEFISNCWCQRLWSPSINPKGAFFCEIAAVIDLLFDGPGGYSVDATIPWWNRDVCAFNDQVLRYCKTCGMAIPFANVGNNSLVDYVSKKNADRLVKVDSPWRDKLEIVSEKLTIEDIEANLKDYAPWEYLGESGVRDKHGKVRAGYAKRRSHQVLSA